MNMHEMNVEAIVLDDNQAQPILLLSDMKKQRALPIWIGIPEAAAISRALKTLKSDRPMTHQLFLNTMMALGYEVDRLEINDSDSNVYFATLFLKPIDVTFVDKSERKIDCRPSDGVAIALIAKAPILISQDLFSEATLPMRMDDETEEALFKEFVQDVQPADFARAYPNIAIEPIDDMSFEPPSDDDSPGETRERSP